MYCLIKNSSQRVRTSFILVALVLIIGYINSYFLIWLSLGILLMLSLSEAKKLFTSKSSSVYIYTLIIWLIAYFYPNAQDLIFILAISYASVVAYKKKLNKNKFFLLFYPTASFLFILSLYGEYGIFILLWLLVIVSSTDIAAYYVGKNIGKTQFSPSSPNKTLEGVIGGVVIASIISLVFVRYFNVDIVNNLSFLMIFILSILISISAVFGDLFESYLKREAGVKDSGNILPGHGGVLDRLDGYLFASIVMLVLLRIVS